MTVASKQGPEPPARRRWTLAGSVCLLALVSSCAKQQEAPSEPSSVAPSEGEPAAADADRAPARKEAAPQQEAPGAAAPAPAPAEASARGDLLRPERQKAAPPANLEAAVAELESSFSDLEKALELRAPDCVTAKQLRDRVCDLAEHICRLADDGAGGSSQRLCGDGRGRCADARKRYEQACPSP